MLRLLLSALFPLHRVGDTSFSGKLSNCAGSVLFEADIMVPQSNPDAHRLIAKVY